MISHVKHVSIPVTDQDRALEFYTKKLGFTVKTDVSFGDGQRWIKLSTPKGETDIILFTMPGQEDRVGTQQNIVFASTDVRKDYAELKQKGVEFLGEPADESWGTYVMFKDTEDNQFILASVD